MNRKTIFILLALVLVIAVGGVFLYDAVLGETEEATEPITALPLEVDTAEQSQTAETTTSGGTTIYAISQDNSEVTFTMSEILRGAPTTVIGATSQVAGEIAVDLNDLSTAQVGAIQINARTLETDEDRRNQAIRNRILFTDNYEFITFTPTEIIGLSGSAVPGQPVSFQITGDLTIRDMTQPITFEVTAQVDENGHLIGSAVTTINRADFDLSIPSVPFVAEVSEEVELALNFTAPAVS